MLVLEFVPASVGMTRLRLISKSWKGLVDKYYALPNHFLMVIAGTMHFDCVTPGCICTDSYFEELEHISVLDYQHNLLLNIGVLTKSQFIMAESIFQQHFCQRYGWELVLRENMLKNVPRSVLTTYIDALLWLLGGETDPAGMKRIYERLTQLDSSVNLSMLVACYLSHFGHKLNPDIKLPGTFMLDVVIIYTLIQQAGMSTSRSLTIPAVCIKNIHGSSSYQAFMIVACRYQISDSIP